MSTGLCQFALCSQCLLTGTKLLQKPDKMVKKNQRDEHFKVRAYGITSVVEMVKWITYSPRKEWEKKVPFSMEVTLIPLYGSLVWWYLGGSVKLRVLWQHKEKQHIFNSCHNLIFHSTNLYAYSMAPASSVYAWLKMMKWTVQVFLTLKKAVMPKLWLSIT